VVILIAKSFPGSPPPRQGGVSAKFHHPTVCLVDLVSSSESGVESRF